MPSLRRQPPSEPLEVVLGHCLELLEARRQMTRAAIDDELRRYALIPERAMELVRSRDRRGVVTVSMLDERRRPRLLDVRERCDPVVVLGFVPWSWPGGARLDSRTCPQRVEGPHVR